MEEKYIPPKINVRDSRSEDAERVVEIRKAAWLSAYPSDEAGITEEDIIEKVDKDFSEERLAVYRERLSTIGDAKKWLIAEYDGQIAGYVFVQIENDKKILQALNVHPDYFGTGVGQQLLEMGIKWLGEGEVELGVVKHNKRAIRFYEKNGFVIDGEAQDDAAILPSGKVMPEWRMVRKP